MKGDLEIASVDLAHLEWTQVMSAFGTDIRTGKFLFASDQSTHERNARKVGVFLC
jgi:hypothetical protein